LAFIPFFPPGRRMTGPARHGVGKMPYGPGSREAAVPLTTSRRRFFALLGITLALFPRTAFARPRAERRRRARVPQFRLPKERKAWIDGKGMCVFPFAADRRPDTAEAFEAAMDRGYRRSLTLPKEHAIVRTSGGTYPIVDAIRIDFCDAVVDPHKEGRKPSDKHLALHALDAGRLEVLGQRMSVEGATVNVGMEATAARLVITRDKEGRPLLVLDDAKDGRMTFETSARDVERLLLAGARKGAGAYGLSVDATRLNMTVEDGRTVRIDLRLAARVGFVPAGLRFRARVDIDDRLDATLSELSCRGDKILGPLISGLIQPFLKKYDGKTRPLMNFPATEMRLRDIRIDADQAIRVTADFGS
jgi:hypothetical protein